jgi:flagellar hook-associated protein 2
MAINSTSSATSAPAPAPAGPGKGSVIDVAGLVSKLETIERVPIDRLGVKVTKQDNAIRDLGIIKERMSSFQAALQDFTDPISFLNKTVTSSNSNLLGVSVSNSALVGEGVFNVRVDDLAKTATSTFAFNFSAPGSVTLRASDGAEQIIPLVATSSTGINSLEKLRDAINQNSSTTKIRAAVINTGTQPALSLTSTTGGLASQIEFSATAGRASPLGSQLGDDAEFTVNGQTFTSKSNTVDNALPGVRLQLQGKGDITVLARSESREIAQTLLTNVGQAYNDLIASYTEVTKFNADPEKRGSLYGFMELRTLVDSITMSFMAPMTRSGAALSDTSGNRISFTSLGLELQLNGSLLFKADAFESAVNNGALTQLANGVDSSTNTIVRNAMRIGDQVDTFVAIFQRESVTLKERISELETRKAEKMARYQSQYAALDALLFRLQALNNSLTPTFEALNNRNNN